MTISEMHIAFKLGLDKTNSLQYPTFLPEEIDFWLNQAIRKFVKTRYSGVNAKREGFEQSQKRIDDLRKLVREVTVPCTATGATKPNGYVLTSGFANAIFTAAPYWLSLGEEVKISYTSTQLENGGITTKRVGVVDITSDTYRSEIDDPLSEHILHYDEAKPLRLFYNDTIEFITDENYSVTEAYIRYIKQPITVYYSITLPVHCDLAEHAHEEIVDMAIQLALENIEQPRLQTYSQEINTME
ncbi:MAG: hypothetical protein IMZ64_08180 [Bacteroidetes bacterium]|nr:hypothetical protein [Bacteroidota bacterium]